MSGFKSNRHTLIRWLVAAIFSIVIVYALPPQGIMNEKFMFAVLSGGGIALTGLWEAKLLQRNAEHPFKAIALGAVARAIIVILAIVAVKIWLPPDMLTSTAISVMIVYFAVQAAELPTLIAMISVAKKELNSGSDTLV